MNIFLVIVAISSGFQMLTSRRSMYNELKQNLERIEYLMKHQIERSTYTQTIEITFNITDNTISL